MFRTFGEKYFKQGKENAASLLLKDYEREVERRNTNRSTREGLLTEKMKSDPQGIYLLNSIGRMSVTDETEDQDDEQL